MIGWNLNILIGRITLITWQEKPFCLWSLIVQLWKFSGQASVILALRMIWNPPFNVWNFHAHSCSILWQQNSPLLIGLSTTRSNFFKWQTSQVPLPGSVNWMFVHYSCSIVLDIWHSRLTFTDGDSVGMIMRAYILYFQEDCRCRKILYRSLE